MPWLSDRNYFLCAVIFYGIGMLHSVFLWREGFRHHDRITAGLLLAGFLCHSRAMILRGMTFQHCPVNNLYEAFTFVIWTIVGVALVVSLLPRFRFVAAFAAPIIFALGVFALMPSLDVHYKNKPEFSNGLRSLHAALSLLSYGAFGLGAVASSMFLTQEHDLKFRKLRAVSSMLPSMERLEKSMTYLSFTGFGLLSAGLALCPFLILQQKNEMRITNDPKVLWSMVVWGSYFVLLLRHTRFGQTGRKFAWGLIWVFAFVLLTFWGINLFSPTHKI